MYRRQVTWFIPSYSKNVSTKIGKHFLNLLDKHFPPNHKFHRILKKARQHQKQPPEVFCKKRFLRNYAKFTGKPLCQSLFFSSRPQACNFIKKETLAQVYYCYFCEISKNTFFYRAPLNDSFCSMPNLKSFINKHKKNVLQL